MSALAQQTQVANHWQNKAFNLQKEVADWKAWGKNNLDYLLKEEQVTADLRQQLEETQNRLAQAQEDLRVEKKLRHDEFNEGVENYNRLVRKSNRFLKCINTIKGQPADAIALITALEAEMKAQQG
ncbi:hypothetical protein B8X00_10065 [Acetobacter fabarum]|uniref:Uncharacterized protein n=1 Tax=Acetobacter fabarum TaxID=483199 RepID=A0A269XWI2_9PROT|nr:hypothetical protein B8X00_10065 [Acetobacter fabarum]